MHELAVTQALIQKILAECRKEGIRRLDCALVEVGTLSNYKGDPIIFYYDALKREHPLLCESRLEVNEVCPVMACVDCGHKRKGSHEVVCGGCGSENVKLIMGGDIILKTLTGD
jgi:Zn finger protein HypA/HybF involved in hydrogenase expression